MDDIQERQTLEVSLSAILSERVLEHLPAPLQLDHQKGGVRSWIDARAEEGQVLLVSWKHSEELIGLMIVASNSEAAESPVIHIGYMLAETAWGQGIASELLRGLVAAVRNEGPTRLAGGVGRNNPASARVLQKAGFVLSPDTSTAETDMFVYDVQ
ncbi:GNAT family N-acetyltransferase [uncultured Ruegeria sp.]|uniref:GNAT family N-acetyltransferase n=1 Tax=uncultured Ruegeria sp. TaxID=259304 RepID=UPI00262E19C6|nr:GNAT family N-acetyltransferase [uncultured Ruegeria sp.]